MYVMLCCIVILSGVGFFILVYLNLNIENENSRRIKLFSGLLLVFLGLIPLVYFKHFLYISFIFFIIALFCRFIDYLTPLSETRSDFDTQLKLKDTMVGIFFLSITISTISAPIHFLLNS